MSDRRRIMCVVGTRPNFMKVAPVVRELERRPSAFEHLVVHTGQHYDAEMSQVFIEELEIGQPDVVLGVGSGSHAQQVARVLERLEPVMLEADPDLVLVAGDVNSTLAAALAATAVGIPIGHVEAGLRNFDRTMIEETNRTLVDAVSDLLFIHSPEARANLLAEGRDERTVHYVGNTMIDTLVALRDRIERLEAPAKHDLTPGEYLVVTLHRPSLVDDRRLLTEALRQLSSLAEEMDVVFPVHPRTRAAIDALGIDAATERLRLTPPLGYLEFLGLVAGARAVLTDSGGIQEETTFLGIPCFTLRDRTERPITVEVGSNTLLGLAPERIADVSGLLAQRGSAPASAPPLWDGEAAKRIVDILTARVTPRSRRGRDEPALQARLGEPVSRS